MSLELKDDKNLPLNPIVLLSGFILLLCYNLFYEQTSGGRYMPTALKSEGELIKVKQYLTDKKGHKVAAVIAMDELDRLETLLETIPPSERWVYKNKEALKSLHKGLKDASEGRISKLNLNEL